jgi:hypothetical protein
MYQLTLQFQNSKATLRDSLEEMTGLPVSLSITDNATSLLSIRTNHDLVSIRMHWMFLNAGEDIIREISGFIRKRKGPTPLIRKFIHENRGCIKVRACNPRPHVPVRTQGRFHDLKELFVALNDEYFGGRVSASISWGNRNTRRVVRKRTLGSYCGHTNSIRINPVLDRGMVPGFFIKYIIYHEMLHGEIKGERKNGRRLLHSPEFRRREQLFKEYEKALIWEKKNFTGNARRAYSNK